MRRGTIRRTHGLWGVLPILVLFVGLPVCGESVRLVEDGKARAILVLPASPHDEEALAARELQLHIEKMSGARLAVVRAGDGGQLPAGKDLIPIRIGLSLCPESGPAIREQSSDPGTFLIAATTGGVRLAGLSTEGTLFAAYALLERLGVRWYLPGDLGTVIPDAKTVSLPVGRVLEAPSFPHRRLQTAVEPLPWARRQKLGGLYFPGCHGIGLSPPADIKTEPELFALFEGKRTEQQLCISHPEVLKRAIRCAIEKFDKDPNLPWIGMGPRDNGDFCQCENCRKLDTGKWDPFSARRGMTDRYVWFYNHVIEAVHKKYPGKKLCFYAYSTCKWPPKKVKPNRSLVAAFAPIQLCRIHGMSNPICPDRSFYKTQITEWGKLVPETFERGYYFNLACPGFPFSKIHAIRDETPLAHELGVKGWRVECMPGWATHGPSLYIAARLMWNHAADVDAILAEFYEKFFGPASEPMGKYLESVDHAYRDTDCHSGSSFDMPHFFGRDWMSRANALLTDAERRSDGKEPYRERVRIFRLSYRHLEAFLAMLAARNRFDFDAANKALARLRAISQTMIDYRLYPSTPRMDPLDPAKTRRYTQEARLLWPRAGVSYLNRFWSPAVESGYERVVTRGEFVAGAPDVWDFLIDPAGVGEDLRWYRDGRLGGNWQSMHTFTKTWSNQGLHYYKGLAWYRTQVTVPERFKDRKVCLWFGGVDEHGKVWVNGKLLGTTDAPGGGLPPMAGTFKPVEFDATSLVRFGAPNTIAVKITNRRLNEQGTGGITAPVMFWSPKGQ